MKRHDALRAIGTTAAAVAAPPATFHARGAGYSFETTETLLSVFDEKVRGAGWSASTSIT